MKNHFRKGLALIMALAVFLPLFSGLTTVHAMDLSQRYEVSWDYTLTDEEGRPFTWYTGLAASDNPYGYAIPARERSMHDYTVKRLGLTGSKSDWEYDKDYVYAYCIEHGIPIPNETEYTGSTNETHGDKWERMSASQRDLLMLALAYGYPNRQGLATSKDANACYSATQLLVWQISLGFRTSPTALNDKTYPMSGHTGTMTEQLCRNQYFKAFYDAILSDMAKHGTRPSFTSISTASAPLYELTQSGGQWTVTLTDTNNVLSDYYVANANGLSATISGNTLTIRSNTPITNEVQIQLERRMPGTTMTTGFLIWSVPGKEGQNQDMVSGVKNDPLPAYLKLKVSTGNLSIIKTSQYNDGGVSGFQFEVRNASGGLVGTYTSGADGVINIPGLVAGTYSVKEINLSGDFVEPVPNPKTVVVTAGGTTSVSFDNIRKRGIITLRKSDAIFTLGGFSLQGAEFAVYDQGGALVDTIITKADGTGQSKILPLGVYRIKEIKAPFGFLLDPNTHMSTISGIHGTDAIVYAPDVSIAETPQPGRINIEKRNADKLKGDYDLGSAVFEVRAAEDIRRIDGSYYARTGDLVDTLITDSTGKAQSKDLHLGKYTVTEKSAPPYGYVRNTNSFPVELKYGGQEVSRVYDTAVVPETPQTGIIRIHKQNAAPDRGDYDLKNAVFEVRAAQDIKCFDGTVIYNKGDLADTVTTNSAGETQTKELPLGAYTVREKTAPFGFVLNTQQYNPVLTYAGQEVKVTYTDVTVPEQPQVGTITVTKYDVATNTRAQGDASLRGAVFEVFAARDIKKLNGTVIYAKDQLVDTLYCGNNTFATTKELPLGDYYVKEKIPPKGYNLDTSRHDVTIEYQGQDVAVVRKNSEVRNKVIEGWIALVKHTDLPDPDVSPPDPQIEMPLEGIKFEVFLKSAGSYAKALPGERDILITDADGYAKSVKLPYGVYTVKELPDEQGRDVKLVAPFDVFISSEGKVYRYILNDPTFTSLVKIRKVDSETGATVPAAGISFRVWDVKNNKWVSQSFLYPIPTTIDVFETAPDGTLVMPEPLISGDYLLYEQEAPWGYILTEKPVPFTIHSTQTDPVIVEVIMANAPAKGIITVEKRGNMLIGVTIADTAFGKQYTPVYSLTGLPGAVFEVRAAADIYTPDGTLRCKKGTLVDTITTGSDGRAATKQLYLGEYTVTEIKAPQDFILDPTPHSAFLEYEGQKVPVVTTQIGIGNTRQQILLELQKLMERPINAPDDFDPYQDVLFGLFADQDIKAIDGTVVIPKGALVALFPVDSTGKGAVGGELPFARYFVKEVQTNYFYQLNETKYPVTAVYAGQDVETVKIPVNNNGIAVPNETKLGRLTITKTGEMLVGATQKKNKEDTIYTPVYEIRNLPGATFDVIADEDLYDVYGRLVIKKGTVVDTVTTTADGTATTKELRLGRYIIVETKAPYGTVLNSTPIPVTLGFDGEVTDVITKQITVHNERQKAVINLGKICESPENAPEGYNPYGEVIFELFAKEDIKTADGEVVIPANALMEIIVFDKNGKGIINTDLPFGSFYVQEVKTAYGYTFDESPYDVLFDYAGQDTAKVTINVNGGDPIENRLQRGSLKIIKVFEGRVTSIENVPFTITGKTAVGTTVEINAVTDINGEILLENLLIGEYTIKELDSDLTIGYVLSDEQTITVAADAIAEMTVNNKLQKGDLKIIKTFENVSTPIAGVKFTVTGVSITGIEFSGEFYTDANGEILIEGLPIGEYKVQEIASDLTVGYVLSDEQTAVIAADELAEMRIDNKLIRGDVKILKTDKATGKPLVGAKFGLYQNGELIAEDITGDDGTAAFLNIPYGEYEIKEISAPEGYKLNAQSFAVSITENGQTITVEVDNEVIPPPPGIPKTGDDSNTTLWLILMGASAAVLVATAAAGKRKKRLEENK